MSDWPVEFPAKEWQKVMLPVVTDIIAQNKALALEIPTGGGKTSFGLGVAYNSKGKTLYLTRTKDQFDRIWEDNNKWFKLPTIYLMGKQTLCARPELWPKYKDDDGEDEDADDPCLGCVLRKLHRRIDCKRIERPNDFVNRIVGEAMGGYKEDKKQGRITMDANEVKETISKDANQGILQGFCPYYSVRSSTSEAKLILATYNYVLNPSIRSNVFETEVISERDGFEVFTNRDDMPSEDYPFNHEKNTVKFSDRFDVVIFDEAHNIDSVIEGLGRRLSIDSIFKAFRELFGEIIPFNEENAKKLNSFKGAQGISVFLWKLYRFMMKVKIKPDDHFKKVSMTDQLNSEFIKVRDTLESLAEKVQEDNADKLKFPRLSSTYNFLKEYSSLTEASDYGVYMEAYLRKDKGETRRLRILPYDHSKYLSFLKKTIPLFFSGTLPSKEHISIIWDLPEIFYLNPTQSGLKISNGEKHFHFSGKLTTQRFYRASQQKKQEIIEDFAREIKNIYMNAKKSVLVAFTNKNIRQMFYEIIKKDHLMETSCVFPKAKMKAASVREEMLQGRKLVLAVHRDSLLEGVEFLDPFGRNLVSDIVLSGVPIPPVDDFRRDFAEFVFKTKKDSKFSKEEMMYDEPALIATKQAIGRTTRSPMDSVEIWLLDYRYRRRFWKNNLIET